MSQAPLVSVVLSFRNEESVIPELIARLQQARVIGLYLARIHREMLGRPCYVVDSTIGFDPPR